MNTIRQIASTGFTEAPVGQALAHPEMVDKEGPGALKSADSTAKAYATIASLVLAAGVLTWIGVPLLGAATEYVLCGKVRSSLCGFGTSTGLPEAVHVEVAQSDIISLSFFVNESYFGYHTVRYW